MSQQNQENVNRPIFIIASLTLLAALGIGWKNSLDESAGSNASAAASARADGTEGSVADAEAETEGAAGQQRERGTQSVPSATQETQAAREAQGTQAPEEKVSANLGHSLTNVIELLNADKFDEALALLEPLLTAEGLAQMTPFERSRVYQLSFNLNMKAESYDAASADIQAALESGGLSEQEANQMEYMRAQLFVQMEDYGKATDSLELWIAKPGATPNKAAYYLLAASYYSQEKYDDARDHMETLLSMPGENQEGWYQMMAALYLQNEDYGKAKPVVEKMVELYDNPSYRDQLAGINAALEETQ